MKKVCQFLCFFGLLIFSLWVGLTSLHGVFINHPSLENNPDLIGFFFVLGTIMTCASILPFICMKRVLVGRW